MARRPPDTRTSSRGPAPASAGVPSPQSSRGQRRPHTPQRCFSRDPGRTETTTASNSTRTSSSTARSIPSSIFHTLRWRTPPPPSRRFLPSEAGTVRARRRAPLLHAPRAPGARHHRHTARADGAVKQRKPPARHYNDSRAPPTIEALLDRRRPPALPALSPQPTPENNTSAQFRGSIAQPARTPTDASPTASRPSTHGSGPPWTATPSM